MTACNPLLLAELGSPLPENRLPLRAIRRRGLKVSHSEPIFAPMSEPKSDHGEKAGKAIARIGGAAAGGFLAPLIGTEAAAATGQALIETTDAVIPFLTGRVSRRVEVLSDQVRTETERRREKGGTFRDDGLLDDETLGEDLLEGVVRGAMEAERTQKAAAVGNVAVSVAFDESISGADALRCIWLIREASWRQLCALVYFGNSSFAEERELHAAKGSKGEAQVNPILGTELSEMARSLELIGFLDTKTGAINNPSDTWNGGTVTAARLGTVAPTGLGLTLLRVGRISDLVVDNDLRDLRSDLGM